jgi:hypothetical protein
MAKAVEQAWQEHEAAINRVRSPAGPAIERSAGISTNEADLQGVVATSEQLRQSLTQALSTEAASPDLVSMKLLAAATYDLGLAKDMLDAANADQAGADRSSAPVFADDELRKILETPLSEMKAFQTERAAGPSENAPARAGLQKKVENFVAEIPKRSVEAMIKAVTGAANFGFGPAQEWLSALTQEIAAKIPEGLSKLVGYAVKLIREAILKLWNAFGEDKQKEMQDKAKSWLKDLLEKPNIAASLLERLYGAAALRTDISGVVDGATAVAAEKLNAASDQLDELLARHEKFMTTLEWIVRGVGWVKGPLTAVPPWGPAVAYGVYAGVIGYTVYLGGDYLDAKGFSAAWLDLVKGIRVVIHAATTAV